MSEFAPLQQDECKDLKIEKEEQVDPPICPTCTPDPSKPKIDWLLQEDPYFDPRTCEYIATFLVKTLSTFNPLANISLRSLVESKKQKGTTALLRHFNKLENDETKKLGFIPDDGIIVDDDSIIKAKLVINAVDFDRIPDAPDISDTEQSPENPTGLPSSIEINDSSFDFYLKFPTVQVSLQGYDVNYQFFQNNQNGILRYEQGDTFIKFNISHLTEELKEFRKQMNNFVNMNGYAFVSLGSYLNPFVDRIEKMRIELDNSNENKPLSINRVFITSNQCPETEIKKGLDTFKKKAYMPTALYFMSNFEQAYNDINAEQPKEWLDFLTEYIYPPIKVDYGDENEKIGMTDCGFDTGNFFKNILEDLSISFADMFEFEFNKNSCSDNLEEREPALKKILETQNEKLERERKERSYQKAISVLKRIDEEYKALLVPLVLEEEETRQSFEDRQKKRREQIETRISELEDRARQTANSDWERYKKKEIKSGNKDLLKHPYQEIFEHAFKERFESEDSILTFWKGLDLSFPYDELTKVQSYLNIVGLCGLTKGLKRAVGCLLKQVSFEQAVFSAVRSVWTSLTPANIEEILLGLPPQQQIEIRNKVEETLGKITPPWELQDNQQASDVSTDVNQTIGLILETYLEVFLDAVNLDTILESFKQYPPVDFILKALGSFIKCPSTVLRDISNMRIKGIKVDLCNPVAPILPPIPKIEIINPFKLAAKAWDYAFDVAIRTLISTLVNSFLRFLENSLCASLEVLGKTALSLGSVEDAFTEALREAICPDASEEDLKDAANSLLNKLGAEDTDISSAFDCLGGALLGTMSLRDMKNLILDPRGNPQLAKRIQNAVEVGCPRFSDLFNNPTRVQNFFDNMRGMIPPEGRDRLNSLEFEGLDQPIYDTICLTSEELNRWNDLRRQNLENLGLSPEEAGQQVELYNNRASQALEDLLGNLNPDPAEAFRDAVNDLMSPKKLPPGCELGEGESMFGSKALSEPKDTVLIQEDIANRIFDIIGDNFKREFVENPNPFAASLISKILSDTRGNSYDGHRFRESFLLTTAQYHDSPLQQERKEQRLGILADAGLGDDRGYFPETIGEHSRLQLSEDVEYVNIYDPLFPEPPHYSLNYSEPDSSIVTAYSKYISDVNSDVFNLDYRIRINGIENYDVVNSLPQQIAVLLEQHARDTNVGNRNSVFNYLLNIASDPIVNKPIYSNNEIFRKTSEKVFNSVKSLLTDGNNGFFFGFEDEDLTEDQLTYVGPDGEEPYSEFFSEEDKVLGRAKEETDRVFFLDPEQYGGTYTVPPVYIAPKDMTGWMKIARTIAPPEESCDPKNENILGLSDIKSTVNSAMNSAGFDQRATQSVEKCFVEKPFDKILGKNALAGIAGVLKVHIRMKIIEEMTKSFSILSMLEWSDQNYDNVFLDKIIESLCSDLKTVNPFGIYTIKLSNYYLLFLEQIYQFYKRTVIDNLPKDAGGEPDLSSLTSEIASAYQTITELTSNFDITNINMPDEEVTINSFGSDLLAPTPDSSLLSNSNYFVYSLAYQKYGESLFTSDERLTYKPSATIFMSKHRRNLLGVIFAIRLVEQECKLILREVVREEFDKIMQTFYKEYKPQIKSLKNYFLTSKKMFSETNIKSFGEYSYEQKISIGSFQSMGQVGGVVDVEVESPWGENTSDDVSFKIERYVRIIEKPESNLPEDLQALLDSRDHNLRGVVGLEDLQSFFDENIELFGDYNITDIFGNAEIDATSNSIKGDIGLSYGIRIVMKLDSSIDYEEVSLADLETSRLEKCYYCNHEGLSDKADLNYSIPICFAEVVVKDQPIKDVNFFSGDESYDLDCLARKLVKSDSFEVMFEYVVPIKAASSMSLLYINEFFIKSIGIADGWEDDVKPPRYTTSSNFTDTRNICRKFFASFYNSTRFTHEENLKLPRLEFPNFFKLIFSGFKIPEIQIGDIFPPEKNFDHRIVEQNPFDKNRQECSDDVDKLI